MPLFCMQEKDLSRYLGLPLEIQEKIVRSAVRQELEDRPVFNLKDATIGQVNCLAYLGKGIIAGGCSSCEIVICKLFTGEFLSLLEGHTKDILSLIKLDDFESTEVGESRFLASGSADCSIKIWISNSERCLYELLGHEGAVNCLINLGPGVIVSGSADHSIKLWGLEFGECLVTLEDHDDEVSSLANIGNNLIISGSDDSTIKVWHIDLDSSNNFCLKTLLGHACEIGCLACLTSELIVSGSWDNSIKVWDISTGRCLNTLNGHEGAVTGLARLRPDRVASGSQDSFIKIWDTFSGSCLMTLRDDLTVWVKSLISLQDGILVAGTFNHSMKVWDLNKKRRTNNIMDKYFKNIEHPLALKLCLTETDLNKDILSKIKSIFNNELDEFDLIKFNNWLGRVHEDLQEVVDSKINPHKFKFALNRYMNKFRKICLYVFD